MAVQPFLSMKEEAKSKNGYSAILWQLLYSKKPAHIFRVVSVPQEVPPDVEGSPQPAQGPVVDVAGDPVVPAALDVGGHQVQAVEFAVEQVVGNMEEKEREVINY